MGQFKSNNLMSETREDPNSFLETQLNAFPREPLSVYNVVKTSFKFQLTKFTIRIFNGTLAKNHLDFQVGGNGVFKASWANEFLVYRPTNAVSGALIKRKRNRPCLTAFIQKWRNVFTGSKWGLMPNQRCYCSNCETHNYFMLYGTFLEGISTPPQYQQGRI